MHIESEGMGSYDVTKVVFTWKRYKRCHIAPLSLVFFFFFFLWCRLFTTTHTCLFRDSSWHTGGVCTASRRWCYRIVMETKMQKWHNRKIHGDVL